MATPAADRERGHPIGRGVGVTDPDLRRALAYLRPYAGKLAIVLAFSLVGTLLSLAIPYLSKALVDLALLGRSTVWLYRIVGLFVGITTVSFALNVASGLLYTRVSADVLFDMRRDLYRHLQTLSPRFYADTPLGEIVSRINSDIGEIQRVASETALAWIGNVIFLVGTVGMLAWLDLRLFLVTLATLPPSLWALVHYRRKLELSVARLRQRSADIGTFLIETLQGMKLVVASNAQDREIERFRSKNDDFVTSLMSMRWLTYLSGGLPGTILALGTALVFLYGGFRVIGGAITLGTFVAFMAYQTRLLSPVQGLMGLWTNLATARVSLGRVQELLETEPDVREPAAPAVLPTPVRGVVAFEQVSFTYDRGGPVLDGVSFAVENGQVLAIVGPSGSGKSTVADLLVRHADPAVGRVLLDGVDLRDLTLAELRAQVFAVDQTPFVFNASIEENVRYAAPSASPTEIADAVRAAGLDDFVAGLPDGLATVVGERGHALSAGERQRIAVARAFLADPAVLVLDEATSALDPATQAQVIDGYEAVMRGRTTVVITHRLELARRADRALVIDGARAVEYGRPDELLAKASRFSEMFGGKALGSGDARGPGGEQASSDLSTGAGG